MVTKLDSFYVFRLQFLIFMYMYTLHTLLFAANAIKVVSVCSHCHTHLAFLDVFVFAVTELSNNIKYQRNGSRLVHTCTLRDSLVFDDLYLSL